MFRASGQGGPQAHDSAIVQGHHPAARGMPKMLTDRAEVPT